MPVNNPSNNDDSGLHDIKALAEMAKRRVTTQQPATVDAAASISLSAIALPEPSRMTPPSTNLQAFVRRDAEPMPAAPVRVARGTESPVEAEAKSTKPTIGEFEKTPVRNVPASDVAQTTVMTKTQLAAAAAQTVSSTQAGVAAPMTQPATTMPRRAEAPFYRRANSWALAGVATAALGGGAAYLLASAPQPPKVESLAPTPVVRAEPPVAVTEPVAVVVPAVAAPEETSVAPPVDVPLQAAAANRDKTKAVKIPVVAPSPAVAAPAAVVVPTTVAAATVTKNPDDQTETVDDLLRGAGVSTETNKTEAPKLEKKELTGADMKRVMGSRKSKVDACYKKFGESGSVTVKVQVASNGQPKNVSVGGAFAGTPTGDCVAAAISGAEFPAWDGPPATVNYAYLLSD